MFSGSAVAALLASSASLSAATSPCKWYHSDYTNWLDEIDGSPEVSLSRCMSAVEHLMMSSFKCGMTAVHNSLMAGRDGNWTREDCDSITFEPHGYRCETHENDEWGQMCRTAEVNKVVDDAEFKTWLSLTADCGNTERKRACRDDPRCHWIGSVGCWPKLHAADVAFCRQWAEGHCGSSMPPRFEDLTAEDMSIFDEPILEEEHLEKFEWSTYLDGLGEYLDGLGGDDQDEDDQDEDDQDVDDQYPKKDASSAPHFAVSFLALSIAAAVLNF